MVTREMLQAVGGLTFKTVVPVLGSRLNSEKLGVWPEGFTDDPPLYGYKVYDKSARDLATELNTTPRAISRLRSGRRTEVHTLDWYLDHKQPTGL